MKRRQPTTETLIIQLGGIENDDTGHPFEFREITMPSLASIFNDPNYDYHWEKITDQLTRNDFTGFGTVGFDAICKILASFETALTKEPYSGKYFGAVEDARDLAYPMKKIAEGLAASSTEDQRQTAYYLSRYARGEFENLLAMAKDIDSSSR